MASRIENCARAVVEAYASGDDIKGAMRELEDAVLAAAEPGHTPARDAAKRLHHRDGELEIDDDAVVSPSEDGGAYVSAWVFIRKDQL